MDGIRLRYNKYMRVRVLLSGFVILALAVAAGIYAWLDYPEIATTTPNADAVKVPIGTPLKMTFSRSMNTASVENRLVMQPERSGKFSWQGNTLTFMPDSPWPSGATVTVTLPAGTRAAGWLGMPLLRPYTWSFSTGQTLLAYLWPPDEPADIYTLDPLTGDIHQVTASGGVVDFSISRDGTQFYYSVRKLDNSAIFRLDLLKAADQAAQEPEPEHLLSCPQASCRLPRLSPDGRLLAYERTPSTPGVPADTQVWLLALPDDGSASEPFLVGEAGHRTLQPDWSSTGKLAYYDLDQQAFVVYSPSSGQRTLLPNQTGEPGSWAPDGESYVAPEITEENLNLLESRAYSHLIRYILATTPDSTALIRTENLSNDVSLEDTAPVFSPDGTQIALARKYLDTMRWTPGRQLWLMQADGTQLISLTDEPFYNHYDFAWSPDGKRIAYVRFNQTVLTEPLELWVVNADGNDPIQLVKGGYAPQWLP